MKNFPHRQKARITSGLEGAASSLIAAWAFISSGSAQAETRIWADTSVEAGIATNPYLLTGPNTDSGSVSVSLAPVVEYEDGKTALKLAGSIQHTEFFRRYNSTESYAINSDVTQRLDPKLTFRANLGFDSSVVGANDLLSVIDGSPVGGGISPPIPGDITLNGLRQRRRALSGSLGFDYTPNTRDRWSLGSAFSLTRYPTGSIASEYDYSSANLGYDRVLNSRTSIGLSVVVSRTDYRRTALGDATTVSPQANFTTKLDSRWSLSASAGITHSSIRGLGGKFGQTSASGSVNLCNDGDRAKFCVFGSRAVVPTALGGVRPQTSVGATYSRRLTERSDIAATANFSRSSQATIGGGRSVDYGSANLTYNLRFAPRFKGYVSAGYADSFRDTIQRRANVGLNVGVTYALGDKR